MSKIDSAEPKSYMSPRIAEALADPKMLEQFNDDLLLVGRRIDKALAAGIPIDETFVREVSQERLEYAQAHPTYPDRPGAGATLETCTEIAWNITCLHCLARGLEKPGRPDFSA